MAFLAVFALALSLAADRLADRWVEALAGSATVRIMAPLDQREQQTEAALRVLQTTTGVASARRLSDAEQNALLAPWFGDGLALEALPMPRLIDVQPTSGGFDAIGLRLRLAAEVPGAVLDDHNRWRAPLVQVAGRLRMMASVCILLITAAVAAIVTLAANAALSANAQVIEVLRLVGATDSYIAQAFIRRFTLRTFVGALAGVAFAVGAVLLLPRPEISGDFLTSLRFEGWDWIWLPLVPLLAATVAFLATGAAARRTLRGLT